MKKSVILLVTVLFVVTCCAGIVNAEVKVSGFSQVQIVHDASKGGKEFYFTVKRGRAIVKGKINDQIGIFAQLEMFTNARNILDLVIDYDLGAIGKIGIGRFTKPFGLLNPVSPYNLHTINYAQVVAKLIGSGGRDFGLRLIGKCESVKWVLAVTNGADGGTTVATTVENNNEKDIIGRVGVSPIKGLAIGVSGYYGKAGAGKTIKGLIGIDVKYEEGPIYAQVECISGEVGGIRKGGYYIEAGYKIGNFQPIVRFDAYDGDVITILAGGVNYYFDKSAKAQLIYECKKDNINGFTSTANNVAIFQVATKF